MPLRVGGDVASFGSAHAGVSAVTNKALVPPFGPDGRMLMQVFQQ